MTIPASSALDEGDPITPWPRLRMVLVQLGQRQPLAFIRDAHGERSSARARSPHSHRAMPATMKEATSRAEASMLARMPTTFWPDPRCGLQPMMRLGRVHRGFQPDGMELGAHQRCMLAVSGGPIDQVLFLTLSARR